MLFTDSLLSLTERQRGLCIEGNPGSVKDRASLIVLRETTDINLARVLQIKSSLLDTERCAAPKIENRVVLINKTLYSLSHRESLRH